MPQDNKKEFESTLSSLIVIVCVLMMFVSAFALREVIFSLVVISVLVVSSLLPEDADDS